MVHKIALALLLFVQDFSRDTIDLLFDQNEKIVLVQSQCGLIIYYSRELDHLVCSRCHQTKCMLARELGCVTEYMCVSCIMRKIKFYPVQN